MSTLTGLIKAILPSTAPRLGPDEAYLAGAVDLHDLERRQRVLDCRGRSASNDLVFSLGLR